MTKKQFTGTAMQPQRNRKFNNDQYCIQSNLDISKLMGLFYKSKLISTSGNLDL